MVILRTTLMLAVALALVSVPASAPANKPDSIGRVLSVRGTVWLRPTGDLKADQIPLARGAYLLKGATIRTGKGSAARLLMTDKSVLDLGAETYVTLSRYSVDKKRRRRKVGMHVFVGRMWARVSGIFGKGDDSEYEIRTPNAVAGVRGTELVIDVALNGDSSVTCVEGSVEVESIDTGTSMMLAALQQSQVPRGGSMRHHAVTIQQVRQMAATVRSGAMSRQGANGRIQGAAQQLGTAAPPPPGGEDGDGGDAGDDGDDGTFDDLPGDGAVPPVDLDPGAGRTRVRGRIEMREQ